MFVGESSYVSFLRDPLFLCIHFVVYFESEMSDLLLSAQVIVHSIITFIIDVTSLHVRFERFITPLCVLRFILLLIHHPHLTPCPFLTATLIPSLTLPMHHLYTSLYQIIFLHCLVIDIIFTLGIFRSMAHELFYTCCILYIKAWVFYYWVFGPSFSSFLLPHLPSLRTSRVLSPP